MQNRSSHNLSSFNITYKIIFDLFQDSADVVEEKNPLSLPDLIQVFFTFVYFVNIFLFCEYFARPDTGADKIFCLHFHQTCVGFFVFSYHFHYTFCSPILSDISILLTFCLFSSVNNLSDCGEPSRVANSSRWWSSKQ